MSEYVDQEIECVQCGKPFVWRAKDQEFYARQGWKNKPKRCKTCREARKEKGERRE